MPLFGAHLSVKGGLHNALLAAQKYECDSVQIFTKNANQWKARELTAGDVGAFRKALDETKIRQTMAHDSYLINLASPNEASRRQSIEAFVVEVQRAEQLGLTYLVMHPGAHKEAGEEAGLERTAAAFDEILERCADCQVQVLIENTAGQGSTLGYRFEHLARIFALVKESKRLGVCLDTCHTFAAGYPLAPQKEYEATMGNFDKIVGLERLRAFHVNDSLKPLGSRVDRHAHIGKGKLGLEPFRLLVNDKRFRDHPMVLETAHENDEGNDMIPVNLGVLRGLVK